MIQEKTNVLKWADSGEARHKGSPVPRWLNEHGMYQYPADKEVVLFKLRTAPYKAWSMLMTPVVKREREFTPPVTKARSFPVGHRERATDNSLWVVKRKSGATGALYWSHVDEEMERQRAEFFGGIGARFKFGRQR